MVVMIYTGGATEVTWEQTEADLSGVGGTQEKPARSDAQEQRIRRVSNQRALFNLWGQTNTSHLQTLLFVPLAITFMLLLLHRANEEEHFSRIC